VPGKKMRIGMKIRKERKWEMIKCLHTFDNDQAFIPWMSVRQGITGAVKINL
jgi:hypothetical protein